MCSCVSMSALPPHGSWTRTQEEEEGEEDGEEDEWEDGEDDEWGMMMRRRTRRMRL